MKTVEIKVKPVEFYVEAINKALDESNVEDLNNLPVRAYVTDSRSIELKLKPNKYVTSSIVSLSEEFYGRLEEVMKNLGVPGRVQYNNTGDIISYWIDSNTKAWY